MCPIPAPERTCIRGAYTITLHIHISLRALCNDNLNGPYHYGRKGLGPSGYLAPMGWKEVPGLFWLDKKRGALCVSFRKDCGAEIWRKSAIESGRGQDFLPTGTAYGPLSVSVYALGGIVHVTQYSHS